MGRYDNKRINEIVSLMKSYEWKQALEGFKKYIKEYPNDIRTLVVYIDFLIKTGDIEEAHNLIERLIEEGKTSEGSLYAAKAKLLLIEGKYQECMYLLDHEANSQFEAKTINFIKVLCLYRLNQTIKTKSMSYVYRQLANYSEQRFKDYMIKNHIGDNFDGKSYFNDTVNFELVYKIVKSRLSEAYKYYENVVYYDCCFRLDKAGYTLDKKEANYITTKTIVGSEDILFMFPDDNPFRLPYKNITDEYACSLYTLEKK